jgi:hypothetical protein
MSDFRDHRDAWRAAEAGLGTQALAFLLQLGGLTIAGLLGALAAFTSRGDEGLRVAVTIGATLGVLLVIGSLVLSVLAGGLCAAAPASHVRGLGFGYLVLVGLLLLRSGDLGTLARAFSGPNRLSEDYAGTLVLLLGLLETARLSAFGWLAGVAGSRVNSGVLRVCGRLFAVLLPGAVLAGLLLNILAIFTVDSPRERGEMLPLVLAVDALGYGSAVLIAAVLALAGWAAVRGRVNRAEVEEETAAGEA